MEWWEKEESYARAYAEGRQARNLWRYIPRKILSGVEWATSDSDGYWIYLNKGWTAYDGGDDCRIIHEYNVTDLRNAIKTIRRA